MMRCSRSAFWDSRTEIVELLERLWARKIPAQMRLATETMARIIVAGIKLFLTRGWLALLIEAVKVLEWCSEAGLVVLLASKKPFS